MITLRRAWDQLNISFLSDLHPQSEKLVNLNPDAAACIGGKHTKCFFVFVDCFKSQIRFKFVIREVFLLLLLAYRVNKRHQIICYKLNDFVSHFPFQSCEFHRFVYQVAREFYFEPEKTSPQVEKCDFFLY